VIDPKRTIFLVDGQTEMAAFRSKFQKERNFTPNLRKVDCNGKDVSPTGYANKVTPIILMALSGSFNTIVCVIDREGRKISSINFAKKIEEALWNKIENSTTNKNIRKTSHWKFVCLTECLKTG